MCSHKVFAAGKWVLVFPIIAFFAASAYGSSSTPTVEYRVPTTYRAAVEAAGGKLLQDYGGFQLFEITPERVPAEVAAHLDAEEDSNGIPLQSGRIETAVQGPAAMRTKSLGMFTGRRSYLVQFAGPVKPEWVEELKDSGARVVSYVPPNSYLVYIDAEGAKRLEASAAAKSHIKWYGPFSKENKVTRASETSGSKSLSAVALEHVYGVQLLIDPEANEATLALIEQAKAGPVRRHSQVLDYLNVVVPLAAADVEELAARPDVISIRPYAERKLACERQGQIVAGNLSGNLPTGPGYLEWLASKGFTLEQFEASGFTVDISDSPIDNGTTTPNHYALFRNGNLSLGSRVIYNRLEGLPNRGSLTTGCDGHGTLNAHIVAGYDNNSAFPFLDDSGFRYGLGICPFVTVGSSIVFDPDDFTNPDYGDLQSRAYNNGARISNNSWGGATSGYYDMDAQSFDALVRDAQPPRSAFPAPGNQEMVIVVAAGNEGPGTQTVNSPGSAKNVITVGASEGVQAIGGADSSGIVDSQANSANDIVSFSSRGPCEDGRNKPDLVAPGTHISGGVYQTASPSASGTADACFDGSGVSGGFGSSFFPFGQQYFTASSGTSHSAPAVSGAAALLRQYFINQGRTPPSPAMTKAYLMNSARHVTGTSGNDTLWSNTQGMGRLNLGTAFDELPRVLRDQNPVDLFTATGQTRTFTGSINDSAKPFRVTLAWTDAPGSTIGNAYNNDLDLVVTANGIPYKGNVFSGAHSISGRSADRKNNVESVLLPAGFRGTFTVKVTAANINSDGVPNNGVPLDQDFALVIHNAVLETKPALTAGSSSLVSESFTPNSVVDPDETVTLNFQIVNIGSGSADNLTATLLATNGIANPSAAQTYGVITAEGGAAERPFTFTAQGECGGVVEPTFQVRAGDTDLGLVKFSLKLGKLVARQVFAENFDNVTAPVLPMGWSTTASARLKPWVSSAFESDSTPNALYAQEPPEAGLTDLVSPVVRVQTSLATLRFRSSYDIEADAVDWSLGYDGAVLEVKIGGESEPFKDIVEAGGAFVSGGYTHTIDLATDNPLSGRRAWAGQSGGFVTTEVTLPTHAQGQEVQFKWTLATDTGNFFGGTGWRLDSVTLEDGEYACAGSAPPTLKTVRADQATLTFTFETTAGQAYVVEYAERVNSPEWKTSQRVVGTGAPIEITDSTQQIQRFYRVRLE